MPERASNANFYFASALVEELVRCGVRHFSVSPGSRSTPLALAAFRNPVVRLHVHHDERASAYFSLGVARAGGGPAAWITTSGTAAVNGHPAIVEADRDGLPLICLTADRPPELRSTGANQTIDQIKLFGDSVRWFFDFPCPAPGEPLDALLTAVDQAVFRARTEQGPVHLNLMFREPLSPAAGEVSVAARLPGEGARCTYVDGSSGVDPAAVDVVWETLQAGRRGLIVAGRMDGVQPADSALALARKIGWPLLPDIRSGLRLMADSTVIINHYDLLLASSRFRDWLEADTILLLGRPVISRRLHQFLAGVGKRVIWHVDRSPERLDPDHVVTHRMKADPGAFCHVLADRAGIWSGGEERMQKLVHLNRKASNLVDSEVQGRPISEIQAVRLVTRHIPEGHGLFLGNSLPVRHADTYGASDGGPVRVAANRGASGIDGNIATAVGWSAGLDAPVTAVVGDLTAFHDLTSLAYLDRQPVTLIVLNNNGGGIFAMLPVRDQADAFETAFSTPHGKTFEQFAEAYGLSYEAPDHAAAFESGYLNAVHSDRSSLIEVRTEIEATRQLHERMLTRVGELD